MPAQRGRPEADRTVLRPVARCKTYNSLPSLRPNIHFWAAAGLQKSGEQPPKRKRCLATGGSLATSIVRGSVLGGLTGPRYEQRPAVERSRVVDKDAVEVTASITEAKGVNNDVRSEFARRGCYRLCCASVAHRASAIFRR